MKNINEGSCPSLLTPPRVSRIEESLQRDKKKTPVLQQWLFKHRVLGPNEYFAHS